MPKANDTMMVVGGSSGIGLAIAKDAHALGCRVAISGRDAARTSEVARSIGAGISGLQLDLENSDSIRAALAEGPPIDHLVITPIHRVVTNVMQFNAAEAKRLAQVKLIGYVEAVQAMLSRLKPTSSIVLFGGLAKANPYIGSTMTSIVNGGVVGMMRTMAVELAPIRVNCISPGLVADSPAWERAVRQGGSAAVDAMIAKAPAKRVATMADVVHAVFFLLDNRAVNGVDLEIDGGIQLV